MIKLLVPDMPAADDLLPYLRRIDSALVYVNNGQLVHELEARLEQITGAPCVTVSNGTVALELALQAACPSLDENWPVAVPAMTFSATGLSVQNAGLGVDLYDIDETTWQMSPSSIPIVSHNFYEKFAAVMPVATFGRPVNVKQWEGYHVPVVIDAAGAFPRQEVSHDSNIATCFSLHATKFVGCGEGGFVASHNKELIERVRRLSTFGEGGTNAKMSEYHAAVALSSLDRMPRKMEHSQQVADWYADHFGDFSDCRTSIYGTTSTLLNIMLSIPVTPTIINKLLDEGIETKQWYRPYLDERTEFGPHEPGRFPVTDHLRKHLLGIPFHNFMEEADVAHVCATLRKLLPANK